ncbi:DUF3108 domain-containing protein [Pelagicoccus albus]|uniref:DUF3108 domain-containing protein n=1 Tax=Pelagicoccus albus TaxID=415222 RepID=A0A7X1B3Y4_9BACT|nr:DUF3108 domain-containing protein [Pelagicoccus albus]MBC2605157.1 DUF3108 domain-containing protein [Pelagicoccus albus]
MKPITLTKTIIGSAALAGFLTFASAQDGSSSLKLSDALENAVYLQEGEADLDAAAKAYENILAETDLIDSLAAETRFRLASVYLEQEKDALAFKILGDLVANYPDQAPWVAEAQALLPKEFVPEITPWKDGERTWYDWVLPTGNVIGYSFSTIFNYEWEGEMLWRKEARYLMNGHRACVIEFDKDTFETKYSLMSLQGMGQVRAWYEDDAHAATVAYSKSNSEKNFNFQHRAYDNEQAYELMRQLPVEVGYSTKILIFVTFSGMPVEVNFTVTGLETLDTILGEVECYKVRIDIHGQEQFCYLTNDEDRMMVKMVAGGLEGILKKVETIDYDSTASYENELHGYSIQLPASWGVVPQGEELKADKKIRVWLAEPTVRGIYALSSIPNADWSDGSGIELEDFIAMAKKKLSDAEGELDAEWERELQIGNLRGAAFRASLDSGKEDVPYVYALLGPDYHYLLEAKIPSDDIEEMESQLERIVTSISVQ